MNHMLIFMISMFLLFFEIGDISPSAYVTSMYNSFWWVVMVSLVIIAAGDVINIDFMHPHGSRKTFNQHQCADSCYVPVENIIQKISTPTTSTGTTNKINDDDYKKLFLNLPNFRNNKLLYIVTLLLPFAKCFISVNKYLIRTAKT